MLRDLFPYREKAFAMIFWGIHHLLVMMHIQDYREIDSSAPARPPNRCAQRTLSRSGKGGWLAAWLDQRMGTRTESNPPW